MTSDLLQLTFDDGPDPVWTPAVLHALAQEDAAGTFFLVGKQLAHHPQPAREAVTAGHEIGLHCHHHVRHTELTESEIEQDARTALAVIDDALGLRPTRWRTPWGVRTAATDRVAQRLGLDLVHWTIDTHDWRGDVAQEMLEAAAPKLRRSAIVLMHDGLGPGSRRRGCEQTVALISPLVALGRRNGLQTAQPALTVDLLAHEGGAR
jgi:peptidoglycan/xylan/chitin deacetylase (PgdA/CDA1 family)